MPYRKYLLVVNRTAFAYFVHKIRKNNPTMVARFQKLGWGHKIRSLFIIRTHTLGQSERQFKYPAGFSNITGW